MTLGEAMRLPGIRAAFARFVQDQREWGAEAAAVLELAQLLPPMGPDRSWHLNALGRRARVRLKGGRWALRVLPQSAEDPTTAANELVERFGVPFGTAWKAVKRGVSEQAATAASAAIENKASAFTAAVALLSRDQ